MKLVNEDFIIKYIILLVISCINNNLIVQCLNIVILSYEFTVFVI